MAEKQKRYTFLLWNGEYGEEANFVVRDNETGKQTFFTPGETQDIVWTDKNLTKLPAVKGWQDFANESVDDLEDVVF